MSTQVAMLGTHPSNIKSMGRRPMLIYMFILHLKRKNKNCTIVLSVFSGFDNMDSRVITYEAPSVGSNLSATRSNIMRVKLCFKS